MRFVFTFLTLALLFTPLWPGLLWATTEAETVIGECQKRTGMGRPSCIEFIKKYMNIERCQQYTKLSASDCQKKMEAIKESPEFQPSTKVTVPSTASPAPARVPDQTQISPGRNTGSLQERVQAVKRDRASRFHVVEEETARIIAFLKEHGQDTGALEEHFAAFQEKREATLSAYDQYGDLAGLPASERPPLSEPRRLVGQVLRDAAAYYRTTLLPELRRALATPVDSPR